MLAATGLLDRATEPVKQFSGEMKRRLNLVCGIVHRPKVLLLDLVREQVATGTCVLYTTHYMEEAEELCDVLAIIDHGKIIAAGTLEELRRMLREKDVVRLNGRFDPETSRRAIAGIDGVEIVQVDESGLRLAAVNASAKLPGLLAALATNGAEIRETTLTQPSLESLFIKLTGKEFEGMTIGQIRNNAQKDLQRALRDPVGLLLWMGIPLVIGSLITLATGGTDGPAPQAHVLVVELEEGRRRIDDGDGSTLLVIPEGFGETVLAEEPTTLRLTTNPAQTILPGIVEETLSILTDATFYLHRVLGDEDCAAPLPRSPPGSMVQKYLQLIHI